MKTDFFVWEVINNCPRLDICGDGKGASGGEIFTRKKNARSPPKKVKQGDDDDVFFTRRFLLNNSFVLVKDEQINCEHCLEKKLFDRDGAGGFFLALFIVFKMEIDLLFVRLRN